MKKKKKKKEKKKEKNEKRMRLSKRGVTQGSRLGPFQLKRIRNKESVDKDQYQNRVKKAHNYFSTS